mgnify:CR=1 FL=1
MAANLRANFIIELSALPDGKFRISARAPRGVITVDAPSPFTESEIEILLNTLARPSRTTFSAGVTLAREFGSGQGGHRISG